MWESYVYGFQICIACLTKKLQPKGVSPKLGGSYYQKRVFKPILASSVLKDLILRVMPWLLDLSTSWYMRLVVAGWFPSPSYSAGYASWRFALGKLDQVEQAKEEGPDEACYLELPGSGSVMVELDRTGDFEYSLKVMLSSLVTTFSLSVDNTKTILWLYLNYVVFCSRQ